MIAHVHGAKHKFKCFTWSKAVRHAARTSRVLREAAEVSLLTTTAQAVTEARFPTCPFYGPPLGCASSHWDGWSASSRVSAKQTVCPHQNWPRLPARRCGIEGINQWRPGCEVHGLSQKGLHSTLKKHSVWALSIRTWEHEQICHVYCPSLSREGKVGVWEHLLFALQVPLL